MRTRASSFNRFQREELKMTSEAQAPGAPAIILYREVNRDDYGRSSHGGAQLMGGTSDRYEEDYYRIKILTEDGRKYANVEIPLPKEVGFITGINARTIRPDGSIVNYDGKVFEKTIYKSKGYQYCQDTHAARCSGGQCDRVFLHHQFSGTLHLLFAVDSKQRALHQEGQVHAETLPE